MTAKLQMQCRLCPGRGVRLLSSAWPGLVCTSKACILASRPGRQTGRQAGQTDQTPLSQKGKVERKRGACGKSGWGPRGMDVKKRNMPKRCWACSTNLSSWSLGFSLFFSRPARPLQRPRHIPSTSKTRRQWTRPCISFFPSFTPVTCGFVVLEACANGEPRRFPGSLPLAHAVFGRHVQDMKLRAVAGVCGFDVDVGERARGVGECKPVSVSVFSWHMPNMPTNNSTLDSTGI